MLRSARRPAGAETKSAGEDAPGDASSSRNRALDGIRGLAALSVALGHCYLGATGLDIWSATLRDFPTMAPGHIGYRLLGVAIPSDAAVMVFFVLSGRVLWQSFVRKRLGREALPDYVLSRVWRLLPLIIAATLLMDSFVRAPALELLGNLLLLQTNVVGVTWSLQVEMVGSLALAAMWLWSRNSTPKMIVALAAAAAIVPLARQTVLVFLPAFALGGLIGAVPANVWRSRALFWSGLAALLTASLLFSHGGVSRCSEMVGATAVVGCMGTRPLRLLLSSPVQFLGAISYPLYLCHPFGSEVTSLIVAPLPPVHPLAMFVVASIVSLLVALPLAWLLHVAIEVPSMHWRPRLIAGVPAAKGERILPPA